MHTPKDQSGSTCPWLAKMAALSSLAVFWRCAMSMRSATGLAATSSNASNATVRSAAQGKDNISSASVCPIPMPLYALQHGYNFRCTPIPSNTSSADLDEVYEEMEAVLS